MKIIIKVTVASIGGFLGDFLGGLDGLIYLLIIFIVLDYITDVMVAVVNKKLSSKIGFRGIFKKISILLLVALCHALDTYLLKSNSTIKTAVILFYLSNEGISLLENYTAIGLPVPKKIKDILKQLKGNEE